MFPTMYTRPILSFGAFLSSIIAFTLAICILLAGRNPSTLPNMELFTLNTSRIGAHIQASMGLPPPNPDFNFTSLLPRDITSQLDKSKDLLGKQGSDILGQATQAAKDPKGALTKLQNDVKSTIDDGKKALDKAATKIKDGAKNATSEIVSTFINETISTLDIHDFYTAHLTTWCEGMYKDGKSKKEITYCSNRAAKNSTGNSMEKHDGPFAFVHEMHLTDPIAWAMRAIRLLTWLISGLYGLGLVCIFIATFTSAFSAIHGFFSAFRFGKSRKLRTATLICSILAFIFLLLGTLAAQFLSRKVVEKLTGENIGLQAQMGPNFVNMSIAATVFAGAAAAIMLGDLIAGKWMGGVSDLGGKLGHKAWFGIKKRARKQTEQHRYGREDEYDMEQPAGQKDWS